MKSKIFTLALLLIFSLSVSAIISNQKVKEKSISIEVSETPELSPLRSKTAAIDNSIKQDAGSSFSVPKASDVSWHVRSF